MGNDLFLKDASELFEGRRIALIELFAGYGSQAMALRRLGADFYSACVVENDRFAVRSYNVVHNALWEPLDIRDVRAADLGLAFAANWADEDARVLTYSFPCTDLSVAGRREGMVKGSGTRSALLWEVERLLREAKEEGFRLPELLFMENVPQVASESNREQFSEWKGFLESLGYSNHLAVLNAKDYGVPQNRKRAYMLSFRGSVSYEFPKPLGRSVCMKDVLEENVDGKYVLKGAAALKLLGKLYEERHGTLEPPAAAAMRGRPCDGRTRQRLEVRGSWCTNALTTMEKDNLLILAGKMDGGYDYMRRVYDPDGVSPTVSTCQGGRRQPKIIDRGKWVIRRLTPRECGRLMGVSDEDITRMSRINSDAQLYKQFGNSIVVDVMCELFRPLGMKKKEAAA